VASAGPIQRWHLQPGGALSPAAPPPRLCGVDPRGRSVNITDGLLRLVPGAPAQTRVEL
jgi:hypothetical protein